MSPRLICAVRSLRGFPRVSGDEPVSEYGAQLVSKFSPRERG